MKTGAAGLVGLSLVAAGVSLLALGNATALLAALVALGGKPSTSRYLGALVLLVLSIPMVQGGRRAMAHRAWLVSSRDARPTILWLRSFGDDLLKVRWPVSDLGVHLPLLPVRFEQAVAQSIFEWGQVLAIGRPGEAFPLLGSARKYVADKDWQREASSMIDKAGAILVVVGRGGGLEWEITQILARGAATRTMLLFPPVDPDELTRRWWILARLLKNAGLRLPEVSNKRPILALISAEGQVSVVEADEGLSQRKLLPVPFGPYRAAIDTAIPRLGSLEKVTRSLRPFEEHLRAEDDAEVTSDAPLPTGTSSRADDLETGVMQALRKGMRTALKEVIHTSVGTTVEYLGRPASRRARVRAFLVDAALLLLVTAPLWLAARQLFPTAMGQFTTRVAVVLGAYAVLVSYFALLESSPWRATVGKRLMKIEVSDLADNRIDLVQGFIRNLMKPWAVGGYWAMQRAPRHQGIHDTVAQSLVVREAVIQRTPR